MAGNQYRFRKNILTEYAVTTLTAYLTNKLDCGSKWTGTFLDIGKAFETATRPIVFAKLNGNHRNEFRMV